MKPDYEEALLAIYALENIVGIMDSSYSSIKGTKVLLDILESVLDCNSEKILEDEYNFLSSKLEKVKCLYNTKRNGVIYAR